MSLCLLMPSVLALVASVNSVKWLKHIVVHVKPSAENKVILVVDGQASLKTLAAVEYARDNLLSVLQYSKYISKITWHLIDYHREENDSRGDFCWRLGGRAPKSRVSSTYVLEPASPHHCIVWIWHLPSTRYGQLDCQ